MTLKNNYKKIFVIAAALFLVFAPVGMTTNTGARGSHVLSLNLSFAANQPAVVGQTPQQNFNPLTSLATGGVYVAALFVNGAMGLLLLGGAYLVQLGLQFNNNIFNSPAIQIGFSVSLAIANLGFVLGIIVIAIATIIRNQTYGIKQLLWKLVFMAILVNFGLVITAPIVGFADSMSTYFINATSPSAATGGFQAYVETMTSAFNPQNINQAPAASNSGSGSASQAIASTICQHWFASGLLGGPATSAAILAACNANGIPTSDPSDSFWQSVMALFFDIAFSGIAAFTFICLAVLLIIRYLMLGGLLIVLPLAWLTYVFPKFDNSYSKWWNTFIKWVFFPPLALFFIYLAFTTATITGSTNNSSQAVTYTATIIGGTSSDNTLIQGMATATGLSGGIFVQAADEVLLVGLMIMGLMFALSLSGKAGTTVVNGGKTVTKAIGGYVGRKSGKAAARAYQGLEGGRLNNALQRSRIPLFPVVGRKLADLTEAGTKNQVEARQKALNLGSMDDDRLAAVTQGLRGSEDQLAAIQEWQKRGKLDKIEKIGGVTLQEWLTKNQGTFKNYSQGKLSGEIDAALSSNEEMRQIARAKAAARPAAVAAATVVDEKGIIGPAGATVRASELVTRANEEARRAREMVNNGRGETFISLPGGNVRANALIAEANAAANAAKDAIEKKVGEIELVSPRGERQNADALMRAASEKFWEGKDKTVVAKMRPDVIFGDKPKFGFDKETLDEIGHAVAYGIVTQSPGSMGSLSGKTDNFKQLTKLNKAYSNAVEEAHALGKITAEQQAEMKKVIKKSLASKLAFMGGGEAEHAPAVPAAPAAPAAPAHH